jgi:hypothetical protein
MSPFPGAENPPVTHTRAQQAHRIDALMEQASQALVERRYFDTERIAADALERAFAALDYERMARILLPLEEARRQKRDLAIDARHVALVSADLPTGRALVAGCYLVCPPRVGIDGRMLREAADHKKVPVVVIVREPTSRDGLWPIVALGPVTIRTKVPPPAPLNGAKTKKPRKSSKKAPPQPSPAASPDGIVPPPEWFLRAAEILGDAAIASVVAIAPATRVEAFLRRLAAHPDHEKLHQALGDACRAAQAAEAKRKTRPAVQRVVDDEEE